MTLRSNLADVTGATRREDTTLRLGGNGDNWHMSWAADDSQFVALCDGSGWSAAGRQLYNSRLYTVTGSPQNAHFADVPGYPELLSDSDTPGGFSRYYGFGTLALDGSIYQFLSTPNVPFDQHHPMFIGAKLIYSPDNGRTWFNQDGSTPVVWEAWPNRSRDNMVFFEESQGAFSLLTALQMGRNYEANKDGYVYFYAPNGNSEGTMNELVMFRVPREQVANRGAYEYFEAVHRNGIATWVKDIDARGIAHTFPPGWVNTKVHPYAWHPSVAYNPPLDVYMMANWGMGCAPGGAWFGKPSYLGLWTALNPWGPWTQIHEETAWMPNSDPLARAYQPQIAPKWIADDGKSFWLVWTDFQALPGTKDLQEEFKLLKARAGSQDEYLAGRATLMPYYAFNTQRVDLAVA